jgi:hypothetical protein
MITPLVRADPVKRINAKYQERFTASAVKNERYV